MLKLCLLLLMQWLLLLQRKKLNTAYAVFAVFAIAVAAVL